MRARLPALLPLAPELLLVLIGAALRLSFVGHTEASYDFVDHQRYIEWFEQHLALPSMRLSRLAYGPPLYHAIGGLVLRLGLAWDTLIALSALMGALRLVLLWWALRLLLPDGSSRQGVFAARLGRCAALGLAVVLPAAVHIDGMVNNESLSMLACWAAMACWLRVRGETALRPRLQWMVGAGALLAVALLTKFSAVMLVIGAVLAAGLELLRGPRTGALRRAAPWAACALVAATLAAPLYARNLRHEGRLFPTAFELLDAGAISAETRALPTWARRTPSFFWQVSPEIYARPYWPTGSNELWSLLLQVTYADHSAYHFAPRDSRSPPSCWTPFTLRAAGLSVAGGTVLALATMIGALALLVGALRRRDVAVVTVLVVSGLAVLGQIYFATQYPVDHYGVIKATYLQFGAAPLYVCFGAVVAWLTRRGVVGGVVSALLLVALGLVAFYTLTSRLGIA